MRGAPCGHLGFATFSPPLRYGENVAYAGTVVRKAERQTYCGKENFIENIFLNPAPQDRPPSVAGEKMNCIFGCIFGNMKL